jgi:orotidine-5'-phosphate decarboxylase
MTRNFMKLFWAQQAAGKMVCLGLDTDLDSPLFPEEAKVWKDDGTLNVYQTFLSFNKSKIDVTRDIVGAYKYQIAYYEAYGDEGLRALRDSIAYQHAVCPDVPAIGDLKRNDIGKTNDGYVRLAFVYLELDAMTVNPFLGQEAMEPFLACKDKGIIVLCKTSNPGSGEFQDLYTLNMDPRDKPEDLSAEEWLQVLCDDTMQLYERIATNVATKWNYNGNCMLVVGATYPEQGKRIREIVGDGVPFLNPGAGAQGADVEVMIFNMADSEGKGVEVNSSRGLIFPKRKEGESHTAASRRATLELDGQVRSACEKLLAA